MTLQKLLDRGKLLRSFFFSFAESQFLSEISFFFLQNHMQTCDYDNAADHEGEEETSKLVSAI